MEFVISKEKLYLALQCIQGVVESRSNAMPILHNALVASEGKKLIRMLGTDLDVGLRGDFEAQIIKGGSITLNAKKLFDIVRELPDADVHLTEEGDQWIRLRCERSDFRFPGLPPSDFPGLPDAEGVESHSVPAKVLENMIRKTMFSISTDETRYTYNGVFMESDGDMLRLVATDGHRLAMIEEKCPGMKLKEGVIVHRKALGELVKVLPEAEGDVDIFVKENHIIFRTRNLVLSARLIDGQFPNYSQVIPQNKEFRIQLDRDKLVRALRRVSLLSSETRMVKFVFGAGQLMLTTNGSEAGEAKEILEADHSGEELTIGFNSRYCLDVLTVLDESHVYIDLKDSLSPGVIVPSETKGYLYVIMPMRV